MALHPFVRLSISIRPGTKAFVTAALLITAAVAAGALVRVDGVLRWVFVPVLVVLAYLMLRVIRHQWWLESAVLFKQRALSVKRMDLSHANVETGYIAGGARLSTIRASDPIHGTKMTIPLLTASGRTLPAEQIGCLHDAIAAGRRFRRGRAAERAATVLSYLQTLS